REPSDLLLVVRTQRRLRVEAREGARVHLGRNLGRVLVLVDGDERVRRLALEGRREPRERRGLLRFVWLVLRRRLARAVGVRGLALLQDRRREDEGRGNQRELDLQVGAEAREHTGGLYGQREIRIAADGEC